MQKRIYSVLLNVSIKRNLSSSFPAIMSGTKLAHHNDTRSLIKYIVCIGFSACIHISNIFQGYQHREKCIRVKSHFSYSIAIFKQGVYTTAVAQSERSPGMRRNWCPDVIIV